MSNLGYAFFDKQLKFKYRIREFEGEPVDMTFPPRSDHAMDIDIPSIGSSDRKAFRNFLTGSAESREAVSRPNADVLTVASHRQSIL